MCRVESLLHGLDNMWKQNSCCYRGLNTETDADDLVVDAQCDELALVSGIFNGKERERPTESR